jgi:hypothetical protein
VKIGARFLLDPAGTLFGARFLRPEVLVIRKCLATVAAAAVIILIPAQAWADVVPDPQPSPHSTSR